MGRGGGRGMGWVHGYHGVGHGWGMGVVWGHGWGMGSSAAWGIVACTLAEITRVLNHAHKR